MEHRTINVPIFATSKQMDQIMLSGQHLYNKQQSDFDLLLCDLKRIGNIYSLVATTVPSLGTFKHRRQKILND